MEPKLHEQMNKIIYLPLEHLEERYTPMFNNAFKPFATHYLYPHFWIDKLINTGEFLDINRTIGFKSKQIQMVVNLFEKKQINDGDIFIVADIFFPGIESIRYMSELQNITVKIFAFNHAGRSDPEDFVRRLGIWSDISEEAYHKICDGVFFGSNFHLQRAKKYFQLNIEMFSTGMIWDEDYAKSIYYNPSLVKENVIIWPHRPSREKGFDLLVKYATKNPNKNFLITSCGRDRGLILPSNITYKPNLSKKEYYMELSRSKYYLSTARQETFGYTLHEAILFGCQIAVPNNLCYPEVVPEEGLYDSLDNITFWKPEKTYTNRFNKNVDTIMNIIKK